ncbi:MAG: CotH kinase family protein [Phycisphaerales bacterium]|nr:MAG: CotH kinase family protein [Phycisphaerales bacterium]
MKVTNRWHARLTHYWPQPGEMIIGCLSLVIVALAALTLSSGATRAAKWVFGISPSLHTIDKHLNPFRTRHALYQTGLPVYDLKIKPQAYREVLEVCEEAKRREFLSDDLKQWVSAKFVHEGVSRDVKVRVRGDLATHWAGERKSWRVKFKRDQPLDGIREINLVVLEDTKPLSEPFTNAVFKKLGVMTLRNDFAILRINGALQGVYYQVEHFDKPFLAHLQRPDGTIFDNTRAGIELSSWKAQVVKDDNSAWQALEVLLDYERNPTPEGFDKAVAVTDMEDYVRFLTGTTLFCSDHSGFLQENCKLYWDRSRGLFYRVAWDIGPRQLPTLYRFDMEDLKAAIDIYHFIDISKFRAEVLSDPEYRFRRNRLLWDLVRDGSLLQLFDKTYEDLDVAFWADVMARGDELSRLASIREMVRGNIRAIRRALSFNRAEVTVHHGPAKTVGLRIAANNLSGINVRGIEVDGGVPHRVYTLIRDDNENDWLDDTDASIGVVTADNDGVAAIEDLNELVLPAGDVAKDFPGYQAPAWRRTVRAVVYPKTRRVGYWLSWNGPEERATTRVPSIKVDAVNAVTNQKLTELDLHLVSYKQTDSFQPVRRMASRAQFLRDNAQFVADPSAGDAGVLLAAKQHWFDKTVVVPRDIRLRIEPGAELLLGAEVSLICHGPVEAQGRKDAPIRILPSSIMPWGAFAVVRPGAESTFAYIRASGGAGASVDGILFTGAIAVHGGDSIIEHCRITNCSAEDALNIKNGKIRLRNTYFADNVSDAVDLDFVTGQVNRCHFVNNAGDALDLSGSDVMVTDNRIESTGDKGISIGEQSNVRIINNLLLTNNMGIAVKDLSSARIENCTMIANDTSVAAWRKKPIFGGGTAEVYNSILLGGSAPVTVDELSRIEFAESIVPVQVKGTDCTVAWSSLDEQLRSNGFVLDTDENGRSGRSRTGNPESALPGILGPPIDLRQ